MPPVYPGVSEGAAPYGSASEDCPFPSGASNNASVYLNVEGCAFLSFSCFFSNPISHWYCCIIYSIAGSFVGRLGTPTASLAGVSSEDVEGPPLVPPAVITLAINDAESSSWDVSSAPICATSPTAIPLLVRGPCLAASLATSLGLVGRAPHRPKTPLCCKCKLSSSRLFSPSSLTACSGTPIYQKPIVGAPLPPIKGTGVAPPKGFSTLRWAPVKSLLPLGKRRPLPLVVSDDP